MLPLHKFGLASRKTMHDGKWLNDKHINFAQALKKQFPHIDGWKETLLLLLHKKQNSVQIIRTCGNCGIMVLTLGSSKCEIKIFD